MAKPGNYAAYQQSSPIREDFGDNMLQAEGNAFRYRQEKRIEEERDYQRNRQERQDMKDVYKGIDLVQTGFEPVDKLYTDFYMESMRQAGDLQRSLTSGKLSKEEQSEVLYKIAMLQKSPEVLDAVGTKAKEYATYLKEGLANGTLSKAAIPEAQLVESWFKGRVKSLLPNERAIPVGTVITEDGQEKKVDAYSVLNGTQFNIADLPKKVDVDDWVNTQVEALGKRQEADIRNGMAGTFQDFNSHRQSVSDLVSGLLGNPQDPNDLAINVWVDEMGNSMSEYGPEAMEQVRKKLVDRIEAGYDETFSGSQYRPPYTGRDNGPSDTEIRRRQTAANLYDLTYRAARGDAEAIKNLEGASRKIGDDYTFTVDSAYKVGEELVLVDGSGKEVTIDLSKPALAEAELKHWFGEGSVAEVDQVFTQGKSFYQGSVPKVGETVSEAKVVNVPTIPVDGVDNITIKDDWELVKNQLEKMFPEGKEGGFKFKGVDDWGFGNHKIQITAPNGVIKEFKLDPDKADQVKESIKKFMATNQEQKKSYTSSASSDEDPLGLGI